MTRYEELREIIARSQEGKHIARVTARHPHAFDKFQKMHGMQLEHAKNQAEARENKTYSIEARKKWIERQNNANYRLEHERIRGALEHSTVPGQTADKLRKRQAELEELFSKAHSSS